MKKLVMFVLILAVIGVVAYVCYRHYLPSLIADTLMSDEPSSMVPAKMQEKVESVKVKINEDIKKLPAVMQENDIAYEDLIAIIDRADPAQFLDAYEEIVSTGIISPDQVFDIVMKHVKIEGYDLEIFRSAFVKNSSVKSIQKSIAKYEDNVFLTNVSFPVIKETAKALLELRKDEIQAELSRLNQAG